MEDKKEINRIKALLINAGFIDAQERFIHDVGKSYFETMQRMFPVYFDPKKHVIDHYKVKNGIGIIMAMNANSTTIQVRFTFPMYLIPISKSPHVSCHIDVSEFQKIQTTKDFWKVIENLFRQHVTPWWIQRIK